MLRCRLRSRKDAWSALGGGAQSSYILAFLCGFVLTMPLVAVAMHLGVPKPLLANPLWGPIVVIWYAACVALVNRYFSAIPRGPVLVLHENGLRYRRRAIPFADLAAIRRGERGPRASDRLIAISRALGRFSGQNRAVAEMADVSARASVLLEFKDGRFLTMSNALANYRPEDLIQFFEEMRVRHPELGPREPDQAMQANS